MSRPAGLVVFVLSGSLTTGTLGAVSDPCCSLGKPAERGHYKISNRGFIPDDLSESTRRHGPDTTPIERLSIKSTFLSKHVIGKSFMSHHGADGADQKHEIGLFLSANGFTDAEKLTDR
jgi:hypothetical protein